ncbi:acyl-CoA carboxylase epsilon subunit [Streptomyces sp. NPDC088757]|uniref:acyl-CoA carboxylase epsilon subunit n=1 Tax=Streptomyces sp. NPDC088757 TaxID=3365889 RepID=UPI0037F20242
MSMKGVEPVLRIERGQVSEDELAALTAVLLAIQHTRRPVEAETARAGSRWWRRSAEYLAPGSWR